MTQRRLVIAGGSGRLGRALEAALRDEFEVRVLTTSAPAPAWRCDLTSIAEAEIALAGAQVVVFLARVAARPARLLQGATVDLDLLMADSVSRAAARVGAEHLVFFACDENDPREKILRASGLKTSVLRGGGPDPVAALVELVRSPQDRVLPAWSSGVEQAQVAPTAPRVWSIQRFERPAEASAAALARAYFEWLPSAVPLVRVEHVEQTWVISSLGVDALILRHSPGRSEPDCCVLDMVGGALVSQPRGRFEFRLLRDGSFCIARRSGSTADIFLLSSQVANAFVA